MEIFGIPLNATRIKKKKKKKWTKNAHYGIVEVISVKWISLVYHWNELDPNSKCFKYQNDAKVYFRLFRNIWLVNHLNKAKVYN